MPRLASHGAAADGAGGGHQPEGDDLRQRGGLRARAGGGRAREPGARWAAACFLRYLEALDARHQATGREVFLALDNGPAHTSKARRAALAERAAWRHPLWLARYSPQRNQQERECRRRKREARSHLARGLRAFVDEIRAGLRRLGGERLDIVDQVPDWWLAGHRREPTGRPPGRPAGAKDTKPRKPRRTNFPAPT